MRPKKIERITLLFANFFSRLTTSYCIKSGLVYFFRFTYCWVAGSARLSNDNIRIQCIAECKLFPWPGEL